uniref:Ribonuclease H-like domain-containing protein n=1 Tax=Tanacetum cinerariifolium TaxID=118510 RepID=A0A699IDK0_TANCI|nr:ribonuclease H-like domain-containing protein [Tanacetum cinerariifolium]
MAQTTARNHAQRRHHKQYARMTLLNPQNHVVPTTVLTQSKLVPITAVRPVTTAVPKPTVTRPRQAKTVVTKPTSPRRRQITRSPSPKSINFPLKVTAAKATMGNPQHALKDKGVIDSRCSWHMTGNMSYVSNFKELNGGYVAFGGNPKGNPQHALKDKRVIDSGCSRHMTENMSYLSDFKELNGGYVAFGGNPKGGKISGKDVRQEEYCSLY